MLVLDKEMVQFSSWVMWDVLEQSLLSLAAVIGLSTVHILRMLELSALHVSYLFRYN